MKIAIVTGAAQGIGRRTAEVLAAAGYGLLLMDLQACAATVDAVKKIGVEVEEVLGDISNETVVVRAVELVRLAVGTGGCAGEQCRHQLYRSGRDGGGESVSTGAGGESAGSIFAS
ncbi:SDR family NAD(P)-dependent oxidoreductase [Tunturiibacter empetritectus]|uniref:SDR family NAD(P)-dependent oxidoreductase n=1 Tax=Tunturiibacter empetritectus TaxID=3069691 RepID=UPI003D9B2843